VRLALAGIYVRNPGRPRIGYLARLKNVQHSYINFELNRLCGDAVPTATLETLRQRQEIVERMIQEQQP